MTAVGASAARAWCSLFVVHVLLAGVVAVGSAQGNASTEQSEDARTVRVTPGEKYAAGWLHRAMLGSGYRDLWTTPIEVPTLNLETFAGGLRPLKRGGFGQTTSLHLESADGRRFVFRSVDKDPSRGLPSLLRGTFVDDIVQDQISAQHPDAALVVDPLLAAAGVLHAEPHLLVMPDTPALGEFREEFAGMLAILEERPDEAEDNEPGFAESSRIVGTERLFDRLENSPKNRVDARDFLAARLMDLYLGDRDRHADQWRWARFDRGDINSWRAIPRDRDQAFFKLGGAMTTVSRFWVPQFVSFGEDYPNLVWATWNGRELDRRMLVEIEKAAWDSVATALANRLTDSVIEAAVRRMPAPHYAQQGAELERLLKVRRDGLVRMAQEYYRLLAEYVDIHATDRDEVAFIARLQDDVEVRIYRRRRRRDVTEDDRYMRRLFHRGETKEIRVFMHGGDDRVVVQGDVERSILIRVVGGGGDDELIDSSLVRSAARQTRFYDARGDNVFVTGPRTAVDREERTRDLANERFAAPGPGDAFGLHERNWGSWWRPAVWVGAEPDVGLFLGGGTVLYTYGFRKAPFKYRLSLRGGYAFAAGRARGEVRLESPSLSHNLEGAIVLRASGIEIINFHGFGNESPNLDDDQTAVRQEQYAFTPSLTVLLWGPRARGITTSQPETDVPPPSLSLAFGPIVKISRTEPDPNQVVGQLRPVGINTFAQLGVSATLRYDSRDRVIAPNRGLLLETTGQLFPPVLSADIAFGKVIAEARTYFTPGGSDRAPTFAVRVGGEKVWGDFPFFEAAFLGGATNLRGFRTQRFAGDGALFGSGELRLPVSRMSVIVPGEVGVFGFADVGRVFFEGETSDRWHAAGGGGVWISLLTRANTVSLGVARSRETVALYAGAGFGF